MSCTCTPCVPMQIETTKSLSRRGTGPALSFTERVVVSALFLHRMSVFHVNLSHLIHNAVNTAGLCPHQNLNEISYFVFSFALELGFVTSRHIFSGLYHLEGAPEGHRPRLGSQMSSSQVIPDLRGVCHQRPQPIRTLCHLTLHYRIFWPLRRTGP